MNSKRCPCGELFVIGFSLDSEVATVLCRRPKGHTGPHSISKINYADVVDVTLEERCPTCKNVDKKERRYRCSAPNCTYCGSKFHECQHPWHSPAPVDAEPFVRVTEPAQPREHVSGDKTMISHKAPAPAEGAEQFWRTYVKTSEGERAYREQSPFHFRFTFAEAYAASLREQLARFKDAGCEWTEERTQLECKLERAEEQLKGNVKELRKAQRELEEARAKYEHALECVNPHCTQCCEGRLELRQRTKFEKDSGIIRDPHNGWAIRND